jgi:GT2 family glycosyltransferase
MQTPIAIIITTFLRDDLLELCIGSIIENWSDDYTLYIGDQGNITKEKKQYYGNLYRVNYITLPYNCGVSFARNVLVKKVKEDGFKHCVISADSLLFNEKYDFKPVIEFLDNYPNAGIVGLNIGNKLPLDCDIDMVPSIGFYLERPKNTNILEFDGIRFKQVEICNNFFAAKTDCLVDCTWDSDLKVMEKEDFFIRLKDTDWQVFCTDYISTRYIDLSTKEYTKHQREMYTKYLIKLKQKYGLADFHIYGKNIKEDFINFSKQRFV